MKNKIVISVKPWKVATGHRLHTTGSGVHQDKRTKRCRTRRDQNRKAIAEH